MKIKNVHIMREADVKQLIDFAEKQAVEKAGEKNKTQIKDLKKAVANRDDQIAELKEKHDAELARERRKIERLEDQVEVFESDREEARDLIKGEIRNADQKAALDARKESLDARDASIRDREGKIDSKEESNYKKGYADGIADGLRKISEVTAKDREAAMKVAMVTAASHTPVANIKELNNVHQLTAGSTDTEG